MHWNLVIYKVIIHLFLRKYSSFLSNSYKLSINNKLFEENELQSFISFIKRISIFPQIVDKSISNLFRIAFML